MIGSGLTKYATENGLKVAKGVAYGNFRGFAATLSEGAGYKQAVFTTKFINADDANALQAELNGVDISRLYRVQRLNIAPNGILIAFMDNPGTMKKIAEFMDWFVPVLSKYTATGWDVCAQCGEQIETGRWILIDGIAQYLHEPCADKVVAEIGEAQMEEKQQITGSYSTGAIGALVGALVGAVVWAAVLCMGYVAALVGLLIGWLSGKGYDLMNGKKDKAKVLIIAFAVIVGVVLGTVGGYAVSLWTETNNYLAEFGVEALPASDILPIFVEMMADSEFVGYIVKDILIGLLFAALGVFPMLKQTNDEVTGTKVTVLE